MISYMTLTRYMLVWIDGAPGRIKKRMIYCKVAVGRAFCVSDSNSLLDNVPDGYDSFYLDPGNEQTIFPVIDNIEARN